MTRAGDRIGAARRATADYLRTRQTPGSRA